MFRRRLVETALTLQVTFRLCNIDKLCTEEEDDRVLDAFLVKACPYMRIEFTSLVSKEKLRELLPSAGKLIRAATDKDEVGIYVLGENPPKTEFMVVVAAGKTKKGDIDSDSFVFIKDGNCEDFEGETDVVALGEWIYFRYLQRFIAEHETE